MCNVLLNFSKAFATVYHLILIVLQKLRNYQSPGNILSWIHGLLRFSLTDHSVLKLAAFYPFQNI